MANPRADLSVISDNGSGPHQDCGYCKGHSGSLSHGMPAQRLTVYAYQDLIDQGWRRSGSYLYKPDLARSCCKAYTIRLDVQQFSPDKGQRRLLRKWRSFLEGGAPDGSGEAAAGAGAGGGGGGGAATSTGVSNSDLPTASATAGDDDVPSQGQTGHTMGCQRAATERDHVGPRFANAAAAASTAAAEEEAAEERALQQLLTAALSAAVADGDLPAADRAAPYDALPAVRRCSEKQRAALPTDVRYTSAAALPLAAAIARAKAGAAKTSRDAAGAATPAGDPSPSQQQRKKGPRKTVPQPDGALSAQDVAQVLSRHFNALVSAGWAPGGGSDSAGGAAAKGLEGAAVPAAAHVATSAPGPTAEAAAGWRKHLAARPETYAAGGHVNIRMTQQQQQRVVAAAAALGGREGAAAAAVGSVGGTDALQATLQPLRARGCGGSGVSVRGGGGSGGGAGGSADGAKTASRRRSASGNEPRAGTSASSAPARSPPGGAAPASAGGPAGSSGTNTADAATPDDADTLAMSCGRLEVRLVPSQYLQEEFELYKRYQVAQHGDKPGELSRASYTRFLVDSPLPHVGRDRDPTAPECGYGSFHQQYWLDGKLIAVGVVDVLPRCLSSVYLFWDTHLASLAPGRFSALQEILWVQRQMASCPDLHFYYMGFYIHTCPKMRYKADYRPSDLLCPVRKVWVRITPQLLSAIGKRAFVELSAEEGALCLPNLAAPQLGPLPAASASTEERGGGSVDDTLVLLPRQAAAQGPVAFEVLRRHNIFPQRVLQMIEQEIRVWRSAVGWAAPSLVYQL